MQAHARVCEENKLEELEKENDAYWNNFAVIGASLKDHIQRRRESGFEGFGRTPFKPGFNNS